MRDVQRAGLRAKPEVGIQFGAGGDTSAAELAAEGTVDAAWAIRRARRCLEAGAEMVMVESEGGGLRLAAAPLLPPLLLLLQLILSTWRHALWIPPQVLPCPCSAPAPGPALTLSPRAGITEDVASWRTEVVSQLVDALGQERLMFEATDPKVFSW